MYLSYSQGEESPSGLIPTLDFKPLANDPVLEHVVLYSHSLTREAKSQQDLDGRSATKPWVMQTEDVTMTRSRCPS